MFDQTDHFAKADRHVSELKDRIARQRGAMAAAELILRALESSLRSFEKYRQVIFDRQEAKRGRAIADTEAPPLP